MALPKALKSDNPRIRIGYLLSNWSTFTKYLTNQNLSLDDISQALEYERSNRNRATFVARLEGRLVKMRNDAKSAA